MEEYLIWKVLEIKETKDEEQIRQAYREKLSAVNPEEDQAGFMRLREAYEQALAFASLTDEEDFDASLKDGDETDRWFYQITRIYEDVEKRKNPAKWKEAFDADICRQMELDSEISERLLSYIMEHHFMPMSVWQTIDEQFHYVADLDLLKEKFPEDFLGYVKYKVSNEEFIDFDLFEGDTSAHADDYLQQYFDVKNLCDRFEEGGNLEEIEAAIRKLEDFDIYHAYADVEKIKYCMLQKKEEAYKNALNLADELYSRYPDSPYVAYYCGEAMQNGGHTQEAEQIYQKLLKNNPSHYMAKYGLAKIMAQKGELAGAKEYCLDLLDVDDRSSEIRAFLDELNQKLVVIYKEKLSLNEDDFETTNKLAWCYFQMQEFETVKNMLLHVPEKYHKEYDFINLIGRNYLALDDYNRAMCYLPKWLTMIEETVEDGSKEAKKRLNRRAFAYFAIGYCQWKKNQIAEATENLNKSIELEEKLSTRLSYMDQLALFYLEAKSYEPALAMCNQILALDDDYFPAYVKRQQIYFELKNGQGVIDDFYECIRLYPPYVKPYVLACKIFYFYKQYEDAAGILKRAEEAGLHSDEMTLFAFKIERVTKKGRDNWLSQLERLRKFMEQYYQKEAERKAAAKKQESDTDEGSDLEEPGELYLEAALLNWNVEDTKEAIRLLDEGRLKYPDDTSLSWLKADVLMDIQEYSEALNIYRRVASAENENPNIHINIGKCLDKIGEGRMNEKAEEALQEYEKAYELNPMHSEINFLLARMYKRRFLYGSQKEKDYELAVFHAGKQIEADDNAYYYIERGLIYEEGQELKKALNDFLEAARLEPDNIYAHNNAGNVCRKLRRFEQGIAEFKIALTLPNEENNVWVYASLADLYETMGEYRKALQCNKEQVIKFPKSCVLFEDQARLYEKLKDYKEAIGVYKHMALHKLYSERKAECKIAKCHYYAGDYHKAKSSYQKAIRLAGDDMWELMNAKNELGNFYRDIGKFKDAISCYNNCIELAQRLKKREIVRMHYSDLAEVYFEMGKREQAVSYAKKALDTIVELYGSLENRVSGHNQYCPARAFPIAVALMIFGNIRQAEKYQQIVATSYQCHDCYYNGCFEAYYGQGLLSEIKGDFLKAAEFYQKALEIKPIYPECRRALERVLKKK